MAKLHSVRDEAVANGHAEAMAKIWVEPASDGDDRWFQWYQRVVEHKLNDGPEPGPRPPQIHEWEFWAAEYKALCEAVLAAHRSGDQRAIADASNKFGMLPIQATRFGGQFHAIRGRLMELPAQRDEATLEAWHREAMFRLAHGRASGEYVPPPPPPPFRRLSEVNEPTHSHVVLFTPHGEHEFGARVRLDPGVSHQLVEERKATWADPAEIPEDPRPPVEQAPGADWGEVEALRRVRLWSRHRMTPGDVPPEEAKALIAGGLVKLYEPPPPPPPPPSRAVFE